jgi:flagellar basal body-associated protein FliL
MYLFNSKQSGASKIPLVIAILVFIVGAFFYFKVSSHSITEQFVKPPSEVHAGETVKLLFNVSAKTAKETTPVPGLGYSFRVEPNLEGAVLDPAKGVTDTSGNIELTLTNDSTHDGEITLWVTSAKHQLEKSMLHMKFVTAN